MPFALHSSMVQISAIQPKNSFFNHISLGFSACTLLPVKNTIAICRGLKGKLKCMRILSCLKSLESSMLKKKKKITSDGWCSHKFLQKPLTFPLSICRVCLVLVIFNGYYFELHCASFLHWSFFFPSFLKWFLTLIYKPNIAFWKIIVWIFIILVANSHENKGEKKPWK